MVDAQGPTSHGLAPLAAGAEPVARLALDDRGSSSCSRGLFTGYAELMDQRLTNLECLYGSLCESIDGLKRASEERAGTAEAGGGVLERRISNMEELYGSLCESLDGLKDAAGACVGAADSGPRAEQEEKVLALENRIGSLEGLYGSILESLDAASSAHSDARLDAQDAEQSVSRQTSPESASPPPAPRRGRSFVKRSRDYGGRAAPDGGADGHRPKTAHHHAAYAARERCGDAQPLSPTPTLSPSSGLQARDRPRGGEELARRHSHAGI